MYDYIPFDYKRAERTALRTKEFYKGKSGRVQIQVRECRSLKLPELPSLKSFTFPRDMEIWLDKIAEREYLYARFHERLEDDFIPSVSPFYGIAEHTAFLGGNVTFSDNTSYHHQLCRELGDFRQLKLNRDNVWIHLVADGMKYLCEKWGDYIPVRMRGADGPSDIASALRGNDLFYDIYDDPEEVEEMLRFCARAVNFTLDLQRPEATRIAGGCITGFGIWMPGNCMGHLSEDFSTMISPGIYEEQFLPALEACVAGCDMAMLHVHSLGHRMIPLFAGIEKIRLMEISSDPNAERAVEIYRRYRDVLEGKTVIVAPTLGEIYKMDDLLESSRTIIWYYAEDEEDAKRAIAAVEKYRS